MPSIDYLTKDVLKPDNQNYCCMSLYMKDDKKTIGSIRVSGAFKTIEETQEQIQLLKEPGHYNFVAEVGSWNAFDPLPNKGDLNEQLNKTMENYLMGLHRKNHEYEQRKYEMIIKNITDNISVKKEELKEYVEKDDQIMVKKINGQIDTMVEKISDYQTKLDQINDKLKDIVIDNKYESIETTENQNKPIKYEGKVKRTEEKVSSQEWYCVSFLTEENKSLVGIKVSGVFSKEDEANSHSCALRDINDSFNILVGKLYEWCPFNPDPDSAEAGESEYANAELNETIKKKKENENKAKLYHELRKNEQIKQNLEESIKVRKQEITDKSNNLENIKNTESKETAEKELLTLDEQIKLLEQKYKEYDVKEKELAEKIGTPLGGLAKKLE